MNASNRSQPEKVAYGPESLQFGELYVPAERPGPHPTVILIHGGFWRNMYNLTLMNALAPSCIVGDEGVPVGSVPHFLPGKNSFLNEMTELYGIPAEAELGGAETMYPAYRDKIKDKFVMPAKCSRNCGGPAGQ